MSTTHQCCPVAGCGVRRDNLSKRGGSNKWWCTVDASPICSLVCLMRHWLHCHATTTAECEDVAGRLGMQVECLPPNCTPILQPCDPYVNALFKQYYRDEWYEWYKQRGSKQ